MRPAIEGRKVPRPGLVGRAVVFSLPPATRRGVPNLALVGEYRYVFCMGMSVCDTSGSSQGSIRRTGMHGVSCCRQADRATGVRMPM